MANILDFGGVRVLTSNAQPGAGYVAKFFVSGTTTPVTVYTDSTLGTPHGVSVTADAAGRFPAVWSSGGAIKAVIEDALGAAVQTIDPVISVAGGGSSAEDIAFTPTPELPQTNVQDAIEAVVVLAANTNLSGRNRIINGQGRINQRGYVSGTATVGANQYTLDRWRVVTSGQSLTFTGNDAGRTMTAPAGGCEQVIEAANIESGTYAINWTGTATCTVNGTPRVKGATFPLPSNTAVTVRFTGGTFTDVQLELGTVATPFERLPIGDELARCQRYYQVGGASSFNTGVAANPSFMAYPRAFIVQMRAAPAVAVQGFASGAANRVSYFSGSWIDTTVYLVTDINLTGFVAQYNNLAVSVSNMGFRFTADAEL